MSLISRFIAIAGLALIGLSQQAYATVLYDNGPINPAGPLVGIGNNGQAISDSFTLSQDSIVTGVNYGAATFVNDSLVTVDWGITTVSGTYPINGTASVSSVSTGVFDGNYPLSIVSFATGNVPLGPGTYYLVLRNQADLHGFYSWWNRNDGPSTASSNFDGRIGSESFQIIGTTTPLPTTWLMLLSGFVGLGYFAYRGSKKNAVATA